jgi:hypothetical protein
MIKLNIHNVFIVIKFIDMAIVIILISIHKLLILSSKLNIFQHRLLYYIYIYIFNENKNIVVYV